MATITDALAAGANIFNQVVGGGNSGGPVGVEQQIASLAQMIANRMLDYETQYKRTHEPLVISLYCHWFLSLLALGECAARCMVHFSFVIVIAVLYYIVYCLSCGKSKASMNVYLSSQQNAFGLYCSLFCGIIGNIITPWRPPLYAFQVIHLTRPAANIMLSTSLHSLVDSASCCSCCCNCTPAIRLPIYKVLQTFFLSYGGVSSCAGFCIGDFNQTITTLTAQVVSDNADLTTEFYQKEYGCRCFEDVVRIQLGVVMGGGQLPSAPHYPVPVPPIPPPYSQMPIATAQQYSSAPIVVQAVPAYAVPSNGHVAHGYAAK